MESFKKYAVLALLLSAHFGIAFSSQEPTKKENRAKLDTDPKPVFRAQSAEQRPQPLQNLQLTMPENSTAPTPSNSISPLGLVIEKMKEEKENTNITTDHNSQIFPMDLFLLPKNSQSSPNIEPSALPWYEAAGPAKEIAYRTLNQLEEDTDPMPLANESFNNSVSLMKKILSVQNPENKVRMELLKRALRLENGHALIDFEGNRIYIEGPSLEEERELRRIYPNEALTFLKELATLKKAQERNRQARIQAMKWAAAATLVGTTITLGHYNKLPVNTQRLFDQAATSLNQTFTPLANTALNGAAYYTPNAVKSGWNSFSSSLANDFLSLGNTFLNFLGNIKKSIK